MADIKVWRYQGSLCWHPSLWDSNDLIWVGYSMIFYFVCIPSCLANSGSNILAVPVVRPCTSIFVNLGFHQIEKSE